MTCFLSFMADFEFWNMSNICKFCRMADYSGWSRHEHAASQHQLHSRHTATHSNKGPKMQQVGNGRFATRQSSWVDLQAGHHPWCNHLLKKSSTTPQHGCNSFAFNEKHFSVSCKSIFIMWSYLLSKLYMFASMSIFLTLKPNGCYIDQSDR